MKTKYLLLSALLAFAGTMAAAKGERTLKLINYKPLPVKTLERVIKNKIDGAEDLTILSEREAYNPFVRFNYLANPHAAQYYYLKLKVSVDSKWHYFPKCELKFESEPDNSKTVAFFSDCISYDKEKTIDSFRLYKNELNLVATKERKTSLEPLNLIYRYEPLPIKALERLIKSKLDEFDDAIIASAREISPSYLDTFFIDLKIFASPTWHHFTNCSLNFSIEPISIGVINGIVAVFDNCISDDGSIPIDRFFIQKHELEQEAMAVEGKRVY